MSTSEERIAAKAVLHQLDIEATEERLAMTAAVFATYGDEVRAETLAGFTEERADRMISRRVPCDCPGDRQHHARVWRDDSPATHVRHHVVPPRRLVGPWEPEP